jgi:hypothetical protein
MMVPTLASVSKPTRGCAQSQQQVAIGRQHGHLPTHSGRQMSKHFFVSHGWHATSMHELQQTASQPQLAGHLATHSGRQMSHFFKSHGLHATPPHAMQNSVSQPQMVGHSALLGRNRQHPRSQPSRGGVGSPDSW